MFSARFLYLLGRAGATFASLVLALGYSRDLGVINRSSISMIMSTNALLWIVLTSGATLTIRKIGWANAGNSIVNSFVTVVLGQFVIIVLAFSFIIFLYSQIKNPIALNLMVLSLLYVTSSGIHLVLMDLLISTGRFKSAGLLEILTISIQLTIYFASAYITDLSVASRVLLAFSISYLLVAPAALFLIAKTMKYRLRMRSSKEFLSISRYNHFLGASLGFMDRADRILVGFFLATPVLGKYAVATALITLLRFFPDGVSKLIMAKKVTLKRFNLIRKEFIVIFGILLASMVILGSREVINFWLGPEWLLVFPIYIAIALQEISRGYYQVAANQKILEDFSKNVHRISILLPLFAILTGALGINFFGLIAIPVAFCMTYLLGIVFLRRKVIL
jgi:O-antigen/teichoic acid export membrane protein